MISKLYPINSLFFYRLIFMAELLLGETIFVHKLQRKDGFAYKAPLSILSCFLFAFIFPIPTSNAFYSMMMFFLFFAYTFFMALLLFKSDWKMILFCLICGYTTEHIAYELYSTFQNFFVAGDENMGGMYDYNTLKLFNGPLDVTIYIVCFVNVYWLIYIAFARRMEKEYFFKNSDGFKVLIIGFLFIIIDIVANSAISYYSNIHFERIYLGTIALINALACILGMLFIFEMYYRSNLRREFDIIQELRKEEKKQYMVSKETIDMINIKCHDFRHQIRELGKKEKINDEAINEVNKLIRIYDSSIKTSNNTLNVILSEKSLTCSKYGINFSCIANGDLINFMSEEDIYSLFGNIVDNAIEAVKNLDKDERIINLKIKSVGNMVSISESNYYEGQIEMQNGLPKSKNADYLHHGYGLKSIRMLANKYHGTMDIEIKNSKFTITLLFIMKK